NAIGALIGSSDAPRVAARVGTGTALTITAVQETVSLFGIGIAPNAWLAGTVELMIGVGMGVIMGLAFSVRQSVVPDELMGRVGATGRLIALCAGPLGAVFGG